MEVKLEEEDKVLVLLSSLPSTYDHLATTIMYGKETLELKDVKKMLQNNKLIKKTNFTEEDSGLVINGQTGRSKIKGPKRDLDASSGNACYYCRKSGHLKKNYMKYKKMLRRKVIKILMGLVPKKSHNKPLLSKKQIRIHVMS